MSTEKRTANNFANPWLKFTEPHVRDLAYALACPPVLLHIPENITAEFTEQALPANLQLPNTAYWQQQFTNYLPRLQQLEKDPHTLNQFLQENLASFRLGFRFEGLLLFWLQDTGYHEYELLAHNLQLFEGSKTLGELDFIVYNKTTNKVEHWEVAIKFLLGEPPFTPACWKGLKGTDTLHKKITHMLGKSLQYESVALPTTSGVENLTIDVRKLIIKGRFYEPVHNQAELAQTTLAWLNPKLPRGQWYNHIPFAQAQNWRMGERVEWITRREKYTSAAENSAPENSAFEWRTGLYFTDKNTSDSTQEHAVMLRLTTE